MAKQQTEDELNIRRKARRRLIGAVALTLVVVVVLPMVLESEPKPTGKDIELRIPSPDKAGAFVPGAAVSEAAGGARSDAPAIVTPAPAANPAVTLPAQQAAPDKTTQSKPAETHAPAESKITDKSASTEGYVAQVGAYTNQVTAKQELQKLKKWGFKAYTERSGDKIRVRVGPYPDRDQAEKAGRLLEKHGMHPVILGAK